MFLNIITPCVRPNFLYAISQSINIPSKNYRWIVVFDLKYFPKSDLIPKNCEAYLYQDLNSKWGFAQRNYAKNMVEKGHLYFNDDDTILHKNLWQNIESLDDYDFISFDQEKKDKSINLYGTTIFPHYIDMHNFIVSYNLAKNIFFHTNERIGDGIFASQCFNNASNSIYINKILSTYNSLI